MFKQYETVIDTIQNGKKQFVNAVITDKKYQEELNRLVDSQTEFAKGSVKSSLAIAESMLAHFTAQYKSFVPPYGK